MFHLKFKSLGLYLILGLSLVTGVALLSTPGVSHTTNTNTSHPPPPDGYLLILNGNVTVPFPLTAVSGVYNASEFNWTADFDTGQTATNYYNVSNGATFVNVTHDSVIDGVIITKVTEPFLTDLNEP